MLPDVAGTPPNCIGYVRVTVNASFTPLIGTLLWFPLPASGIQLPRSTVDMPAESLGFMRAGCAAWSTYAKWYCSWCAEKQIN